jgi:hypothetical protein
LLDHGRLTPPMLGEPLRQAADQSTPVDLLMKSIVVS